jgi:tetratricopeptide (TPR) repeat protein
VRILVRVWLATCLALWTFASAPAGADVHTETDTPWSKGVSKANQSKALALFKEGNDLYGEQKYSDALVPYEKAIKLWDHPSIQYNLALCLMNIRQPLEAWDHLERALRYGEGPLGKRLFSEAGTYRNVLEASLAQLEVSTEQEDVVVELDGRQLLTGPGKQKVHLLAGSHQLVATLNGYKTLTKALDLPAGQVSQEDLQLSKEVIRTVHITTRENYERRWAWWVPWATAAGSVAVALIATGVYVNATDAINAYDTGLANSPACKNGCTPSQIPASLTAQELTAEHEGDVAIAMWTGAAVIGVAAGVMAILNRPKLVVHTERPDQPSARPEEPDVSIRVTPLVAPGMVGAGIGITFR